MDKKSQEDKERYRFGKAERLSSKKLIDLLFREGKYLQVNSIRCIYLFPDKSILTPSPVQIVISAPKKLFKRAVDRNLMKRRIREAYRLHKNLLIHSLQEKDKKLVMAFLVLQNKIQEYHTIEKTIKKLIDQLIRFTQKEK
ncbi:MAG: ribonuclease P protein component [Bacteroidales bacterium]|nr:ribonuclease P protein component [Bacteroidales bacterium]